MTPQSNLLTLEIANLSLRVVSVHGTEAMQRSFQYQISARILSGDLDAEKILGERAEIVFSGGSTPRSVVGSVWGVKRTPQAVVFDVRSAVAWLDPGCDHRVFVDRDALGLAQGVFSEHGIAVIRRTSREVARRGQHLQCFESDGDFVRRILAEEGVSWHADPSADAPSVVLCDDPASFHPIEGDAVLPYRAAAAGDLVGGECLWDLRCRRTLVPERATLRDYDFAQPKLDMTTSAGAGEAREHYDHPGRYAEPSSGSALAAITLERQRREAVVLEATSSCRRLAVGRTFEIADAPRDDLRGPWLVVALEVHASALEGASPAERRFEARVRAVPADAPHRPAVSPPPFAGALSTADVTGPDGSEIHTDADGSVKARWRWDRTGTLDDASSRWLRVMHPPTHGGFFLPRVGWEALMGFRHGCGDEPWVLGRLDHGAAPPAEHLPAEKGRSAFGTPTTPGGGSANLISTDDRAGSENVRIQASRNLNDKTASNKASSTKGSDKIVVSGKQTLDYEQNESLKCDSGQSVSVGGSRKVGAGGGIVVDAASEQVSVGGLRKIQAGGDLTTQTDGTFFRMVGAAKVEADVAAHNRHVSAASTIGVGGALIEATTLYGQSVAGLSMLASATFNVACTNYSLKANVINLNAASETNRGSLCAAVSQGGSAIDVGSMKIMAPTLIIKAKSLLRINAGGAAIELTPGGVRIAGDFKAKACHYTGKVDHK